MGFDKNPTIVETHQYLKLLFMALDFCGTFGYLVNTPIYTLYLPELHGQSLIYYLNMHFEFRWECYGDFVQASHDHHLASHVAAVETKLLEMNGQVSQVLEACNANAKVMGKLNATIESFM